MQYAVRFGERANRESAEAVVRLFDLTDNQEIARSWLVGLREAAGTLNTNPRRFAVRPTESRFIGLPVRRLLYRRPLSSTSSPAYHLFYFVEDQSQDGPLVFVFHIRHAARRPMTRRDAKEIAAELG